MKWKRTAMSLALAGCMMATTVPVTAFAANTMAVEQQAEYTNQAGVSIAKSKVTSIESKTDTIVVSLLDVDGVLADDGSSITEVKSSNESVATVEQTEDNNNNKLNAVTITPNANAKAGDKATITITVEADGAIKKYTCEVEIIEEKSTKSISLSGGTITVAVGEKVDLPKVTFNPEDTTDSKDVTWAVSNNSIADIDTKTGVITGKATGSVKLTATVVSTADEKIPTVSASTTIVVTKAAADSITLDRSAVGKKVGDEAFELHATVEDKAGNPITDPEITWDSSNKSVATVEDGKVTPLAKGQTTISASINGKTAYCVVTVDDKDVKATSVSIPKTATVAVGEKLTIVPTFNEGANTDKDVTFTPSDNTVTVTQKTQDENGNKLEDTYVLTATKAGTYTVTCALDNGQGYADMTLTVTDAAASQVKEITLADNKTMDEGTAISVGDITTVNPTYIKADDPAITWTSNTSNVVIKDGKIYAVKVGQAVVTATAGDKSDSCVITVDKSNDASVTMTKVLYLDVKDKTSTFDITVNSGATPLVTNSDDSVAKIEVDDVKNTTAAVKVTPLKAGTTTITATVGSKTATTKVVVVDTSTPAPSTGFVDVPANAWYANAVNTAAAKGLMNGTGNNKFEPLKTVQRSQVAAIVWNIEGAPAVTGTTPFTDVAADAWYAQAVTWAYQNKVVSGTSATTFAPNQNITRQDFAVVLYNKAGKPAASADLSKFVDASKINSWAQDAVKWAVSKGIINGNDKNELNPTGTLTRAEAASIIVKYVG